MEERGPMRMRGSAAAAIAALLAFGLACSLSHSSTSISDSSTSISDSSTSSSDSVSNSSRSSSGSSSPDSQNSARYEQDVADYTEAYVVSGGADSGFLRGVGDIARKQGLSDWEADRDTWEGIGRGLARLELGEVQLEVFKSNWSGGDDARLESIQRGYDAER